MNGYSHQAPGAASNQLPQLTPLSNLSTRPYQQDSPGPSQTLPPLHTHTQSSNFGSNPYRAPPPPPNPRSPQTSAPPAPSVQRTASLSQIVPQQPYSNGQPQPYTPIAPNYSSGPPSNYGGATANPPSAGVNSGPGQYGAMTLPQPPAFFDSPHGQNGQFPLNGQYQTPGLQGEGDKNSARNLPVVGSQGRRGILPSATGSRPPPVGAGPGMDNNASNARITPTKGPDGKYNCQYCNKVYLHLKHLKRHHLRHTGERPYQCCLCHETFCRSDILKRHFQKCSLRRGNPTGANHLTHAQAHLGKVSNPPTTAPPPSASNSVSTTNPALYRTSWQPGPGGPTQPGQEQVPNGHPPQPLDSNGSSRSSSIIRPGSGSTDDRKRFSGPNFLASINNSIDTSPTSSGGLSQNGERKGMYPTHLKPDQQPPASSAYQGAQSSFYTHPPPPPPPPGQYQSSTQPENFSNYQYNAQNGYRPYPPSQYEGMPAHESMPNYFQPSGQDPVMFSHQ